jgi:hypothetical protein
MKAMLAVVATVACMALVGPGPTEATLMGLCTNEPGQSGLGACTKTVTFDAQTDLLTITLQNTSPPANGGFLTADAFDLTGAVSVVLASFSTTNPNFELTLGPTTVNPFGTREFLISATDNDWEGGGNPSDGIPAGGSATFTVTLTGDITEQSMFGSNEAIRFRGFENDGSDKTLTTVTVSEPATLLFLAAGLIGVSAWGQRRRSERRRR